MGDSLREEFQIRNFGLSYPDYGAFLRPQWSIPKWLYPVWKGFWLVWHLAWLVASGVRTQNTAPDDSDGPKWFIFLSNVTFLVTSVTCLLDFILVVMATCSKDKASASHNSQVVDVSEPSTSKTEKEEILFQGTFTLIEGIKTPSTPWFLQLLWMLYEAMNCANLLTTIIFWATEYGGEVIHADVIVFNAINIVFVVSNLMISNYPVRLLHFIYPALYAIFYFLLNLIFFLCDVTDFEGHDVTFQGLDWSEALPTAVTIPVGLLVAVPLGHLVFFTLFTLRDYLATRRSESDISTGSKSKLQYPAQYRRRNSNGYSEDATDSGHRNEAFEMDMGSTSTTPTEGF